MTISLQQKAVDNANLYIGLSASLIGLYQQIKIAKQTWSDNGIANVINSFPTRALSADGSLGTSDGSTVTSHPIDTVIMTGLNRNLSAQQIASLVSLLDNIVNFVDSSADVPIQGGVRQILNTAV